MGHLQLYRCYLFYLNSLKIAENPPVVVVVVVMMMINDDDDDDDNDVDGCGEGDEHFGVVGVGDCDDDDDGDASMYISVHHKIDFFLMYSFLPVVP